MPLRKEEFIYIPPFLRWCGKYIVAQERDSFDSVALATSLRAGSTGTQYLGGENQPMTGKPARAMAISSAGYS